MLPEGRNGFTLAFAGKVLATSAIGREPSMASRGTKVAAARLKPPSPLP